MDIKMLRKTTAAVSAALLLALTLAPALQAGPRSMAEVSRYRGLDMHVADIGGSMGVFYQWSRPTYQWGLTASWLTITEHTYYDYWGYPHKINEISLDFVKFGILAKYHIFKGKIDNAFSPFLSVQGGGMIGLDTPEGMDLFDKFGQAESIPGYYGGLYAGVDLPMGGRSAITLAMGAEQHVLSRAADGKKSWGGKSLIIQLGSFIF